MKKKSICMLTVFVCTMVVALAVGIKTRNSFVQNMNLQDYLDNENLKVENYEYFTFEDYDIFKSYSDIETLSELEKISDIIVKVKMENDAVRLIYDGCVLSDCIIEKVYKGEISENIISVFEPVDCNSEDMISMPNGYNLMQDGNEYILFLNDFGNGTFSHGPQVYVFSTILYSKFDVNSKKQATVLDENILYGESLYSTCKNNEVLLPTAEVYEKIIGVSYDRYNIFYDLKKQVMKKYQE